MNAVIGGNFESMERASSDIKRISANYRENVSKVYDLIQGISSYYEGEDYNTFVETTNELKPTINSLGDMVENYGIHLHNAATRLRDTQERNVQNANRI